ncbi:HdeD family acid-resistance protein [Sphingomonas sp. URHD0057]|uniref:HdeD family acid-resistance protein n=1 Tax=Sphingomonas sp. URHD0057 TaxID=1380389 RepID=UPI00048E565B|nr:DUF308 domain-containing protein [Sphingomonas sp. URHD0057]
MADDSIRTGFSSLAAHAWGWVLLRGILALALGVAAIMFPLSAIFAFTLLFAAYAFVDGIASLVAGTRSARSGERWGAMVFRGITGILVGVIFVLLPMLATVTYAFLTVVMVAVWSVIAGIFEISAAIRLRKAIQGEWLLGLAGAFSLLLGMAILVLVIPNPVATILSAAWLIAIYAFAAGLVLVAQAFSLKRIAKPVS